MSPTPVVGDGRPGGFTPKVADDGARRGPGGRWGRLVARLAVAALLVALLIWRVDWTALDQVSTAEAWPPLVAAGVAGLLAIPLKAFVWRGVLREVPGVAPDVVVRDLTGPVAVGAALNALLPARAGEVARIALARRRLTRGDARPSASALAGSIASESLYSALAWLLVVVAVAVVAPVPPVAWIVAGALAAFWLAAMLSATRPAPAPEGRTQPSRGRLREAMADAWDAVIAGQRAARRPRALGALLAASVAAWLVQALAVVFVLRAFNLDHGVGLAGAGLILVATSVAQVFPLVPGNIGLFQLAVALPLMTTYGVSEGDALAVGIVLQTVLTLPLLAAGGVAALVEGLDTTRLRLVMHGGLSRVAGAGRLR